MVRAFRQVDVFTNEAYLGNPVAVVLDGTELDGDVMLAVARWTNLSETTFVLPPTDAGADYRVRIFTPASELPFAGHPTLGTCQAWLEAGGEPRSPSEIVQECQAGLVRIRRADGRLAFAAPPVIRSGPLDDQLLERIAVMLGLTRDEIVDGQWVDNGPGWAAVLVRDAETVLALRPKDVDRELGVIGPGGDADFEVRAFFTVPGGSAEDPVTGSLNGSVAQWLLQSGRATAPYVASQGTALGRRGRVYISADEDGTVWVGGDTVTCIAGTIEL